LERLASDLERDHYLIQDPGEFSVTIMRKSAWKKIRAREKGQQPAVL
jgi:hypothetical protein